MDTKNWKEFRVGDLFDVETSPSFDMVNINILNKMNDDYKYEFIIRSKENNGVKGYVGYLGIEPNEKNKITISQVGTIVAQYRTNDYYTSQNVFNLSPKFDLTENKALFFVNSLNCMLRKYFGYSDYPTLKSLKNEILLLPTKNDKPDFEYMEEYIEEIKLKYVDKLEKDNNENIDKALKVTGLSYADLNKDLTVKSADRYEEFRVGDLFDSVKIKGINNDSLNKDFNNGIYNYITRTSFNFGISDVTGKIDNIDVQRSNVFSLGLLNMDFFFQSKPWYAGQFVRAIVPKYEMNNNLAIYFQTVFNKRKHVYTQVLVRNFDKTFLNDIIVLPAIDENTPDFDYMEKAIYIYIAKKIKLEKLFNEKKIKLVRRLINE